MKVKVINKSSNPLPAYATEFAAGLDVRADNAEPIELKPLGRAMVPTGLYLGRCKHHSKGSQVSSPPRKEHRGPWLLAGLCFAWV